MGFFTQDRTVSVSSVPYNLAGDVDDRREYMKTIVIGEVLSPGDSYLGETVANSLLNGPGIVQRNAVRWSDTNFNIGQTTSSIRNTYDVDPAVVAGEITPPPGETILVQQAFVESANFYYYAQKHIYENDPILIATDWTCDYDPIAEEIIIQYEDTSTEVIPLVGYGKNQVLLIAYYESVISYEEDVVVPGTLFENISPEAALPSTTGYVMDSDWTVTSTVSIDLTETTDVLLEYTDATPDDFSTSDSVVSTSYDIETQVWIKETYAGTDGIDDRTVTVRDIRTFYRLSKVDTTVDITVVVEDIGGGVNRTTTTTVTTEALIDTWSYRDDTQNLYSDSVPSGTQMLIYKMGSGNVVLDALSEDATSAPSEFYPFIPLRIDNVPVDDPVYAGTFYDECNDAYKRMTGEKFQAVLDDIDTNPDIADIDFAYLVFGVSLNVQDYSSRKYVYDFLKSLIPYQITSSVAYDAYIADRDAYEIAIAAYNTWFDAQSDSMDPLYGTPAPTKPALLMPKYTTLKLNSPDVRVKSYDLRLSWITISEDTFSGVGKPGAKPGDVWMEAGTPDTVNILLPGNSTPLSIETLTIYRQQDEDTYTTLTCKGLIHENHIYEGKKVSINSSQALLDPKESGFIIPMHNPTMKAMSLVDSTQVSMENMFIVFNCYTVTVQPWYTVGIFQVFLAVAIAVVTVYFAPVGAVTGGILGTNAVVGSAIGLTGTSALLVGAAANAIAAMVLVAAITEVSTQLFGEKWGGAIGVVLGFVVMQGVTSLNTSGQLGLDWGSMMRMDNIMNLAQVGTNAYSAWVQGDILEIQAEMVENTEKYEQENRLIQEQMDALGFNDGLVIDPMWFTDVLETQYTTQESPQTFINRTTMVGSDMISMQFAMIYDYVEINQTLPTAGI